MQDLIKAANDQSLLDFYHNFDLLVGFSSSSLQTNAELMRASEVTKEAAAIRIQDFRERTFYQLVQEIEKRGLKV